MQNIFNGFVNGLKGIFQVDFTEFQGVISMLNDIFARIDAFILSLYAD